METVESWHDGGWSTLWSRRAFLERNGETWWVRVTEGSEARKQVQSEAGTEEQARARLRELFALGGRWTQVR